MGEADFIAPRETPCQKAAVQVGDEKAPRVVIIGRDHHEAGQMRDLV